MGVLEQQVKERQEKVDQEKEFHESFGRRQLTDFVMMCVVTTLGAEHV